MLINCPECGHRVSDKAPVCPGCGIEIAGHIKECRVCGKYYLDCDEECPHCNKAEQDILSMYKESADENIANEEPVVVGQPINDDTPSTIEPVIQLADEHEGISTKKTKKTQKKQSHTALLVSFVIAALICTTLLYFYKDAITLREAEDYKIALNSKDTLLLQSFIESYKNTNRAHVETIRQQLEMIKAKNAEETQKANPEKEEATQEESKAIIEEPQKEQKTEPLPLTSEETQKVFNAVRRFFVAINTNNREALTAAVSGAFSSINGKAGATKNDIIQFLVDQYQADVKNLNWHLGNQTNINRSDNAEDSPSYHIVIPAKKVVEREDVTSSINYMVSATVDKEGKITSIDIKRE